MGDKEELCTPPWHKPTHNSHINTVSVEKHASTIWLQSFGENLSNYKYVAVELNGSPVHLQIDTASNITLISQALWKTIGQPVM